jgi:hypothetical protein
VSDENYAMQKNVVDCPVDVEGSGRFQFRREYAGHVPSCPTQTTDRNDWNS